MNNRAALFAQAIRGPILLITIGVLFAVHQAGIISFARTWPLIIIVVGLMKLIERMFAQSPAQFPAPPASPPYGGPVR
jgi:hypothetical protein